MVNVGGLLLVVSIQVLSLAGLLFYFVANQTADVRRIVLLVSIEMIVFAAVIAVTHVASYHASRLWQQVSSLGSQVGSSAANQVVRVRMSFCGITSGTDVGVVVLSDGFMHFFGLQSDFSISSRSVVRELNDFDLTLKYDARFKLEVEPWSEPLQPTHLVLQRAPAYWSIECNALRRRLANELDSPRLPSASGPAFERLPPLQVQRSAMKHAKIDVLIALMLASLSAALVAIFAFKEIATLVWLVVLLFGFAVLQFTQLRTLRDLANLQIDALGTH